MIATDATLALVLGACGGTTTGGRGTGTGATYNAGVGQVYNPSTTKGGTLRFANAGDWDSLDPADTYYAYSWNFIRLYGRQLVMFAPEPGAAGAKLVPDLAETLGVPSNDSKTWTYKIRKGMRFEDGSTVTSKDVKYAVERSLDKQTFPNGPTYFNDFLDLRGYTSPYQDPTPDKLGLKAIETPDDSTIVFHLAKPFSGFDYFAQLPATIPVPRAKDTGTKYKQHVVSTGPYKFESNELGKKFTLVRNDQWNPATDPIRTALPDRIEVTIGANADDIDNRLISGNLDVDVAGTGVQPATQGRILSDPNLKKNADAAATTRLWYTSINPDVAPLDNIHCRKAVEYAADHTAYQRAYGGPAGGDIATNLLPPLIPGAKQVDLYNFGSKPGGDADSARQELQQCGQPSGFATNMSYRAERPKEKATAEAMQQALAKVGIRLTLKPFPQGDYFKLYAGKPDFAKNNKLGLMTTGWSADWPDGFGFLQQIVDSRVIRASGGNTNLSVKIPEVDHLIDQALLTTDTNAREQIWAQIDKRVMEEAVALPGVWAKTLLYRPPTLTNVFVTNGFGMYDYLTLGVQNVQK
ncbi:MAG TPA: ABC transporter substrate-binding protein [Mycobacteriales bacterium]|nr:ABC transporter substrate-binding protein [Mycobacteriales bacterium]